MKCKYCAKPIKIDKDICFSCECAISMLEAFNTALGFGMRMNKKSLKYWNEKIDTILNENIRMKKEFYKFCEENMISDGLADKLLKFMKIK
jgi:arsenate reductase-like glutaredoxin family protein